ncbi:hypothetical protein [Treponema sp.]|uniref:hypothetical protein n=1 Tax=Treponema sp. TaxID=166 RepID=UPI00298EC7E3|nr:hypothetical protein [Treponema sp.]
MKKNFIKIAMGVLLAAMVGMFAGCAATTESLGSWGIIVETGDGIDSEISTEQIGEDLLVTVTYTGDADVCYLYDPFGNGENMDTTEYDWTPGINGGTVTFYMPEHNVRVHLEYNGFLR